MTTLYFTSLSLTIIFSLVLFLYRMVFIHRLDWLGDPVGNLRGGVLYPCTYERMYCTHV
jgi:hypothetical protein